MKRYSLPIFVLLFVLMARVPNAYAIDSFTTIELRNSYKQFEKCMKDHNNDISKCLEEFNKAFEIHKKTSKKEPANESIKNTLLLLVNTMNDIAETYYSAAEKKKGAEPTVAGKYYSKAAICYEQLVRLYPTKSEFTEFLKSAKYLAKYEEVEGYIFELKGRKRLDYALLSLQTLKASRDSFTASFGENGELNNTMNKEVGNLEKIVRRLFQGIVQKPKPEDMKSLIYLIQSQLSIIEFDGKQEYKNNLAQMEQKAIQIIKNLVDSYKADFNNANSDYKEGRYAAAGKSLEELLAKMGSFPDYSTASSDLRARIANATSNFDVVQFRQNVGIKEQVAKATATFLSMVDKGTNAFQQKDWLSAYNTFREAGGFAKGKDLAVKASISQEWFNKVQKKIDDLDDDEITSMDLARLHYKPMSYSEWLEAAQKGTYPKNFVSLSGSFQQKSDDVVILKKATIEYDWNLDVAFQGSQMNSVGLIFQKERLFRDDDFISCIGKFKGIDRFRTVIGQEIQIPVFKVVYCK